MCCFFFCSIFQLPAQCCAVAMVSTLKEPAYATVAGKVQNVMYPSASVLIPRVEVMVPASKGTVSVLLAIKEKTVKKVMLGTFSFCIVRFFFWFWSS